jgi:uncharacterized protein YcbK (DUF882 family)
MRALPRRSTLAVAAIAVGAAATVSPAGAQPPVAKPPARAPAAAAKRAPAQAVPASRGWHVAPPGKLAPQDERGRPMLVLQGLNIPDRVLLTPRSDRGGFSAEDLDRAAHVMRDHAGNEHPVDPRLIDMVYRLQTHFHAPEIRIISGYRTPRGTATSNHGKGRAMDLVVPGAGDDDVAKFARDEGYAGVGVYPVSGFVHVDVRERSYFWVDTSGPSSRTSPQRATPRPSHAASVRSAPSMSAPTWMPRSGARRWQRTRPLPTKTTKATRSRSELAAFGRCAP